MPAVEIEKQFPNQWVVVDRGPEWFREMGFEGGWVRLSGLSEPDGHAHLDTNRDQAGLVLWHTGTPAAEVHDLLDFNEWMACRVWFEEDPDAVRAELPPPPAAPPRPWWAFWR